MKKTLHTFVLSWTLLFVCACSEEVPPKPQADQIFKESNIRNVDYVEQRLNEGLDPNFADNTYVLDSLLTYAVREDAIQTVRLLLDRGANVDVRSQVFDKTPLFQAAYQNRMQIAQLLIYRGASINAVDSSGNNALREAIIAGHAGMVQLLIEAGCDPAQANSEGQTMLDLAKQHGSAAVIQAMSTP